jgi:hypothetical protein
MLMRIGIDPGQTTGFAICDEDGKLVDYGSHKKAAFFSFLHSVRPTMFVVENFKIRPNINFTWNEMEVIRIIGAVEFRAHSINAKVVFQEPSIKPIGYKWAGITVPKDHGLSHATDAWAHLTYYNHKILKLPIPAIARMKENGQAPSQE